MTSQIRLTGFQLVGLTGVLLLGFAASLGMAFNIDAIALSYSASNSDAGLVASVEMAAIAAGNLSFARLAMRLPAKPVYLGCILAIAVLNLASTIAPTINWLIACRAPAGFALGAIVATVMTTAGRSHRPESTFGVINSMVGVMGIFIAFILPRALNLHTLTPESLGWAEVDGLYLVYTLSALCALLFIGFTPKTEPLALDQGNGEKNSQFQGWLGLAGLGIIFFGHGTLALFIVKIGREIPLSPEVIGYVFMAASGVGILLPLLSGYLGSRIRAMAPIMILLTVLSVSAVLLSMAGSPTAFFLLTPIFAMLPVGLMPIFLGCLARVDPSGSLAGSHAAFVLVGGAIAPFAGGTLSDLGGFTYNGWFVALCVVVGGAMIVPVIMLADRNR